MSLEDRAAYYAPKDLILWGLLKGNKTKLQSLSLLHNKIYCPNKSPNNQPTPELLSLLFTGIKCLRYLSAIIIKLTSCSNPSLLACDRQAAAVQQEVLHVKALPRFAFYQCQHHVTCFSKQEAHNRKTLSSDQVAILETNFVSLYMSVLNIQLQVMVQNCVASEGVRRWLCKQQKGCSSIDRKRAKNREKRSVLGNRAMGASGYDIVRKNCHI